MCSHAKVGEKIRIAVAFIEVVAMFYDENGEPMFGEDEYHNKIFSPVCTWCAHYQGARTCAAFPDGIPPEIFLGENDHTQPYEGDHGILFEQEDSR